MKNIDDEESDDEKRIMKMNWKRMENQLMTNSFREGALAGKDKYLQANFDSGYKEGYKRGYHAGRQYGEQQIRRFLKPSTNIETEVENSLSNFCDICSKR